MFKKLNFLLIIVSLVVFLVGVLFLVSNYQFYLQANKTEALIVKIDRPDLCSSPKGCYWTRKVFLSFHDSKNSIVNSSEELFTPTLITGIFTTGGSINILYKAKFNNNLLYETIPNIGVPAYEVKIYTWQYWTYPILTILLGPLLYFVGRKLLNEKLN